MKCGRRGIDPCSDCAAPRGCQHDAGRIGRARPKAHGRHPKLCERAACHSGQRDVIVAIAARRYTSRANARRTCSPGVSSRSTPIGTGSWRRREISGRFAGSRLRDTLWDHYTRSPLFRQWAGASQYCGMGEDRFWKLANFWMCRHSGPEIPGGGSGRELSEGLIHLTVNGPRVRQVITSNGQRGTSRYSDTLRPMY